MPAVVVRQRKAWRRRDGVFLYFEVCIYPSSAPRIAASSLPRCYYFPSCFPIYSLISPLLFLSFHPPSEKNYPLTPTSTLPGQRRRHCEPQRRDERFCDNWSRCKRMRESLHPFKIHFVITFLPIPYILFPVTNRFLDHRLHLKLTQFPTTLTHHALSNRPTCGHVSHQMLEQSSKPPFIGWPLFSYIFFAQYACVLP